MNRITTLAILAAVLGTAALQATDFTLIDAIPKRVTALKNKSQKGWDSGLTGEMRKATYDYANGLKAMIAELAKTYYPEGYLTKEALEEYVTALYAVAHFKKRMENVTGGWQGTNAPLEVQGEVCSDLEEMVASIVEAVATEDGKYNLERWQKKWEEALK